MTTPLILRDDHNGVALLTIANPSWVVDDQQLPASLLVTAISAEGYIMSIKHQVYESHGIQFHPESYMTDMGKELMQGFLV